LVQRLLDIPKDVIWDGIENFIFKGGAQRVLMGFFQILNIIVFLSLLEDTKLLIEGGVEVFDTESCGSFFEFLEHSKSEAVFVLSVHVPNILF